MKYSTTTSYIMEDDRESGRLAMKVDAQDFYTKYLSRHIDSYSKQILDIGCGPGVIAAHLARCCPDCNIIGIDSSERRIEQAKSLNIPNNMSILLTNAYHLQVENNQIDFAYCRFLLEYLKEPDKALGEMYRVITRGGKLLLQDLDGQLITLYPKPPFSVELDTIIDYLIYTGFDPFIGRKLFSLAIQAGFEVEDVTVEPYHLYAGVIHEKEFKSWELKLQIAMPHIEAALGSFTKAVKFKNDYLTYLKDPGTFCYSNLITVVCFKK